MSKPDCATCGQPAYSHSGGTPNFCPIIATYRPKDAAPPPLPDVRAVVIAAYEAGATDVHNHWAAGNHEREADFTEAAHDYADCALSTATRQGDAG